MMWRCLNPECADNPGGNAGHEFDSETLMAVCPKCGASRAHPRTGQLLVRLATIHFDPPTKFKGIGENRRACDGKSVLIDDPLKAGLDHFHGATGDPGSVTCRECKQTDKFKAAAAAGE